MALNNAPIATIIGRNTRSTVDENDRLWLLRSVEAEGQPRELVAQTLVNRWAFLRDSGFAREYPTLASFIRAYSSPMDPRFTTSGHLTAQKLRDATSTADKQKIATEAARNTDFQRRMTFSDDTKAAVQRALFEGPKDLPAGVIHFAANYVTPLGKQVLVILGDDDHNAFYRTDSSVGYLYSVAPIQVQQANIASLAIVGGLLYFGYKSWRRRERKAGNITFRDVDDEQ